MSIESNENATTIPLTLIQRLEKIDDKNLQSLIIGIISNCAEKTKNTNNTNFKSILKNTITQFLYAAGDDYNAEDIKEPILIIIDIVFDVFD